MLAGFSKLAGYIFWLEMLDDYGVYAGYYWLAMLVLLGAKNGKAVWLC
jgi:hypothetical protein